MPASTTTPTIALAAALKQNGVKPKVMVFPTGYDPAVINSPAWSSIQGGYFDTTFRPFQIPERRDASRCRRRSRSTSTSSRATFPTFSQYESWLGADLMIKGLQLAGKNPTRSAVISDLRTSRATTATGCCPRRSTTPMTSGKDLPKSCGWYMIAEKNGFVPASTTPTCGTDIPGTSTASS